MLHVAVTCRYRNVMTLEPICVMQMTVTVVKISGTWSNVSVSYTSVKVTFCIILGDIHTTPSIFLHLRVLVFMLCVLLFDCMLLSKP